MCDQELIAAILEELGYLDKKKEDDKKEKVRDKENIKDNSKTSRGKQFLYFAEDSD